MKISNLTSEQIRRIKQANSMREHWASKTPEDREIWISRMKEGRDPDNHNNANGLIEYHNLMRPERVAKAVEFLKEPPAGVDRNARKGSNHNRQEAGISNGVCVLLAAHHELLKDDPERLSTEFLEGLIGIKCQCKMRRNEV